MKDSINKLAARIGQEFKKLRAEIRRDMDALKASITTTASSSVPHHSHPKSDIVGLELKLSQLDAKDSSLTAADAALTTAIAGKASTGAVGSSGLTMATARLLGRSTAATGAIEEISVGSGLTLSGGVLTASGSFAPDSNLATATYSVGSGNNILVPAGTTVMDFSGTGTITGFDITPHASGKVLTIYVRSGTLTIANESASSSASNRIVTGQGPIVARAGSHITLATITTGAGLRRWVILGTSTPPIFTSSSDIEPSSQSGYVDTVVRGVSQDFTFKRSQTLTGIASTQNNLAIDSDNTIINLASSSSGVQTITGFANGAEGRIVVVKVLLAAANGVTLAHNSGGSLAANRFLSRSGADVTIAPGGAVMLAYGTGGWYILG